MVDIIPHVEDLKPSPMWVPTEEEQDRGRKVHKRINALLEGREPYETAIERSLLLYSGKSRFNPKDARKERVVMPFARIFVESKTAEEVRAFNEYEFTPVEESGDRWKAELLKDVDVHVRRKVKMRAKKHQLIRMKNIAGVGIGRIGYKKTMRTIKERVLGEDDGDNVAWVERDVPVYDDLYFDCVSPLQFAVDPNATTMDDAMDCVHFHAENWEVYYECYSKDDRFKNTDQVKPGMHGVFGDDTFESGNFRGQAAIENQVVIAEYFNKIRDEWIVYANGVEIYHGPLPDDHKELPFISYHNNANFVSGFVRDLVARNSDGNDVTHAEEVRASEGFWSEGDPNTIMDLIDLRTGFSRAAYQAIKLAGQSIIATLGNFRFDESKPWRTGAQAVGAMGKYQVDNLGNANISSFQFAFEDLMNVMILTTGADPRNLSESKTKTATEAAIQRETSMRRLEQNIEFNEENGEVRLGNLVLKLIQQRYSKPEIVRLTGMEGDDELSDFHDIETDPDTGKPFAGKRFRRIKTNVNLKETQKKNRKGEVKYTLSKSEEGVQSFLARPDYIRVSDVDVQVQSGRRAGEIRAVEIAQARDAIEIFIQLFQLAQPAGPGMKPPIDQEDLPNLKLAVEQYVKALGWNPEEAIGQGNKGEVDEVEAEQMQVLNQYFSERKPINPELDNLTGDNEEFTDL